MMFGLASSIALLAMSVSTHPMAAETEAAAPLRLCADPDNLPFTSSAPSTPGLYVELAQYLAARLNRPFQPIWAPSDMVRRMLRDTLLAKRCDLFIGLPNNPDLMGPRLILSRPLLDVGFALVTPQDSSIASAADLAGKRVAAQHATPPQHWLADHSGIEMVTVLSPEEGMQALQERRVDAALLWGPSAGYLNNRQYGAAYRVAPIQGELMQLQATIGFAKSESALRDQVDQILAADPAAVANLKQRYGFPDQQPIAFFDAPAPIVKVAAGEAGTVNPPLPAAKEAGAPASSKYVDASPAPAATSVEDGRVVFNTNCSHCHGPNAIQPERRIDLRLLKHRYGTGMDEMFHATVTHGRVDKGMPNWSDILTEQDFAEILSWLHSVQNE